MRNGIITAPFKIHHNQGNDRDEHEAGPLFVHEEEERQSKHNQNPEERSSQGFDHREARMVICYVVGEGIRLMVYTAVSAASPQKCLGREAEMKRVWTTSRM